jgi:paraquat-inducible protein A
MDCDLLHSLGTVPEGATARCRRCAGVLRKRPRNSLERTLALALAAAILFLVSNGFPFLSFEMKGRITETTLMTGILDLYDGGKWEIAALVFLTIELAPVVQLGMLLYVLVPLRANRIRGNCRARSGCFATRSLEHDGGLHDRDPGRDREADGHGEHRARPRSGRSRC